MVRAKRAIDELCSTLPSTGTFSSTRSAVYCILGERLYAYMKAKNAASATPSISHHHPTNMSRSEEHTSELQSLMRISYAVFCLKKKTNQKQKQQPNNQKYEIT